MKKILSLLLIIVFILTGSLSGYAAGKFPVLMYHNVTKNPMLVAHDDTVHITAGMLEEHFKALSDAGYNAISLEDYYLYRKGEKELPSNPVLITFDDGYTSNYEYAYPLFKKYNMKAVIFVITSRMGATYTEFPHFSWTQAREMENSGLVEIESHSFSHPDFSTLNYAETVLELRLAKYSIEKNLNKKCRFFAYPYGQMNAFSTNVAANAGYSMVCVGREKSADLSEENLFEIPRYTVRGSYSGKDLIELIKNGN